MKLTIHIPTPCNDSVLFDVNIDVQSLP